MSDEMTIPADVNVASTLIGYRIFPDLITYNDNGWTVGIMAPNKTVIYGNAETPLAAFADAVRLAGGKMK